MKTDKGHTTQADADELDRVRILDTTLRDGEQSPGAAMTHEEKIEVAALLDEMGVDIIEAGFPIASNGDFEAVNAIAKQVKSSVVCGLSRAGFKDIDRAGEALKPAMRRRIHTFISTSPVHMKHKLQMEPSAVLEAVAASVARARNWTDDVQWSAEDATRTEHDFLCRTRGTGDQGRRCHHQYSRHGRLCDAAGIFRADPMLKQPRARRGARRFLHPLPQRSGPGRRQFAGRRAGRRAPGRMHHQRHRRTRRQCRAGRNRDGDQGAQGPHALHDRHQDGNAGARLQARVECHGFSRAVQQGHRGQECLCARSPASTRTAC